MKFLKTTNTYSNNIMFQWIKNFQIFFHVQELISLVWWKSAKKSIHCVGSVRSRFFWCVFFRIQTVYKEILRISDSEEFIMFTKQMYFEI